MAADTPVGTPCDMSTPDRQLIVLTAAPSVALALSRLCEALSTLPQPQSCGSTTATITRIEIEVEAEVEPAHWLAHQCVYPRVYFSNQHKTLCAAGVGAAARVCCHTNMSTDAAIEAAVASLAGASERTRFYGGMSFDPEAHQGEEWHGFGGGLFILPLFELQRSENARCFLACHLRWSSARPAPTTAAASATTNGTAAANADAAERGAEDVATSWDHAARKALLTLHRLNASTDVLSPLHQVVPTLISHEPSLSPHDWEAAVKRVLQGIEDGEWSKVVLAQRMNLRFDAPIEPLHLLLRLLEADDAAIADDGSRPGISGARHAYLFLMQLDSNTAFMGCPPEKLFELKGDRLTAEALAGTRGRGDSVEADRQLAHELLHCEKDLREVTAVRDFLLRELGPACDELEHSTPFILQLRHVQHICVPFSARLRAPTRHDYSHVRAALSSLHPTPAVCGVPSATARSTIRNLEPFDRGFYAGPFGCLSSNGCEFCVAIRSALVRGSQASIFAGAGIVRGSTAVCEWEEVHVKMKNFVSLFPRHLPGRPLESPWLQLPNLNALHASLMIEELLRSGLAHVVLCPGSRCAPITVAVVRSGCAHTLANDERGAAFMALGFARASGRCAAVVVSSGTAVANLLPAVVEAAQDRVPLLLLTADRPPEARDTGANQTITQPGLLSLGCLRWFKDVPCPSVETPIDALLSDASYALARACGPPCGPVHLNFMLREPLAPSPQPWPREVLFKSKRVARWLFTKQPFTSYLRPYQALAQQPDAQLLPILTMVQNASRGVLIAGALQHIAQQQAIAVFAAFLGWPLLTDVCSGLRVDAYSQQHTKGSGGKTLPLVPLSDVLLSDTGLAESLAVDVVVQVGGRLVSKHLQALAASSSAAHVVVEEHGERADSSHSATHRLQGDIASIIGALHFGLQGSTLRPNPLLALVDASRLGDEALQSKFHEDCALSEPWVARHICTALIGGRSEDEMLFASNSLPIRHLNSFCVQTPLVLSNRGASGIDGILHTAIGAAIGGAGRCTLLVGDLATLHDLNALALLPKAPLLIIILNNHGGGIFRMLPIAKHEDYYSPYFDTPHEHSFEQCCQGFGLPYEQVGTREDFTRAFEVARRHAGPHVIEVLCDKELGNSTIAELRGAVLAAAQPVLATTVLLAEEGEMLH